MNDSSLLNDPINPDYEPPKVVYRYEVEARVEGGNWTSVDFGDHGKSAGKLLDATDVRDILEAQGYKTRLFRIETLRTQIDPK
ncbi:hypothetical protein [Micromonospora sp. CB01531]|uniref:hypothetical protein n=1 Tax=Micromonospora sp. CB01531 TaxID=1718947 RepID=UPI00093EDDC9|nr:hypothetical protein [Micromonospora sp. CB01531]OKI54516.1 hypothetical protein A6A27_31825 [Micromonospora sp. CB01531]